MSLNAPPEAKTLPRRTFVGIDLGTTQTCAIWKDGCVKKPSVFTYDDQRISSSKRLLGRTFQDPVIQDDLPSFAVETKGGMIAYHVDHRHITPTHVATDILEQLRQEIGLKDCIITVPAYFTETQRLMTISAAEDAGWKVDRVMNEPTAAALAHYKRVDGCSNILVYDLGGGTFDVTLLSVEDGFIDVQKSSGDAHLGGDDFTKMLEVEEAEQVKILLSTQDTVTQDNVTVTRTQFEALTNPLLDRTREKMAEICDGVELDAVIMVGGATRMPCVRRMIEEYTGLTPLVDVDPDLSVARGAYVRATDETIYLSDVTSHAYGINVMGENRVMIHEHCKVPIRETRIVRGCMDDQQEARIQICAGTEFMFAENELIGSFTVAANEGEIELCMEMDDRGCLSMTAKNRVGLEKLKVSRETMNHVKRRPDTIMCFDEDMTREFLEDGYQVVPGSLTDLGHIDRLVAKGSVGWEVLRAFSELPPTTLIDLSPIPDDQVSYFKELGIQVSLQFNDEEACDAFLDRLEEVDVAMSFTGSY